MRWPWQKAPELLMESTEAPEREEKLFTWSNGSVTFVPPLITGPGSQDLIAAMQGYGKDTNSAVFACLDAKATAFTEAPFKVWQKKNDGERLFLEGSALQSLLDMPNPAMDGMLLWYWTEWVLNICGDAFWRKIRAGNAETGNVIELWPISPLTMEPVTDPNRRDFISYWKHTYAPGKEERISTNNIVHFQYGVNDRDHRVGNSPLARLSREILGDDLAMVWQSAILRNSGLPGALVNLPVGTDVTEVEAAQIADKMEARFGNGNQGKWGVLRGGATISQLGFNPEQMAMDIMHRVPEQRISAVLRVPAIIAGLGAGLERATYANFKEARAMFTELTIKPLWRFRAATIGTQLKPDFTNRPDVWVDFDLSEVTALQEDLMDKWTRLDTGVVHRWITPNEARSGVGYVPLPGGDELAAVQAPATQLQLPPGNKAREIEIKTADFERYPELLDAMTRLAEPAFTEDVDKYLKSQKRRVQAAIRNEVPAPFLNGRQ